MLVLKKPDTLTTYGLPKVSAMVTHLYASYDPILIRPASHDVRCKPNLMVRHAMLGTER